MHREPRAAITRGLPLTMATPRTAISSGRCWSRAFATGRPPSGWRADRRRVPRADQHRRGGDPVRRTDRAAAGGHRGPGAAGVPGIRNPLTFSATAPPVFVGRRIPLRRSLDVSCRYRVAHQHDRVAVVDPTSRRRARRSLPAGSWGVISEPELLQPLEQREPRVQQPPAFAALSTLLMLCFEQRRQVRGYIGVVAVGGSPPRPSRRNRALTVGSFSLTRVPRSAPPARRSARSDGRS